MNREMQTLLQLLEQSERNPLEQQLEKQSQLLKQILEHAHRTTAFYNHYAPHQPINTWPILTRAMLQSSLESIASNAIPKSHGNTYPLETSGSTGETVRILGTHFTSLFYDALMLREHSWHKRDVTQKLLSIRWLKKGIAMTGQTQSTWGPPINRYKSTGPSMLVNIASDTASQIKALLDYQPFYLATYPSQACVLADYCLEKGISLPQLHEIRTTGETLTSHQITVMKTAWPKVKISDIYSCVEIGSLAQQCPEYQRYHINTEHVYLEIVDNHNQACKIGETGRVLVTSLLNYATPLIRYELGDYATLGDPCPCGRNSPVIQSIEGRKHNRLILPDGSSRFPYLGEREELSQIAPLFIKKFQFIQHTHHHIEIKIVTPDTLSDKQEAECIALYQTIFGFPADISITYHETIPSGPTGKFEEFISLVESNDVP